MRAVAARPWNIWASGYGGNAHISGDPLTTGSHDTSVRDYGYAAGLDYRIAPDTAASIAPPTWLMLVGGVAPGKAGNRAIMSVVLQWSHRYAWLAS
jgi:hypothetical protein